MELIMTSLLLMCSSVIPHTVARSEFVTLQSYSLHTSTTELQLYGLSLHRVTLLVACATGSVSGRIFLGELFSPKTSPKFFFNYLVHTVCILFTLHTF